MMEWALVPVWFVVGMMGWSFSEYALHNWGGHKARGRNPFSREHLKHHKIKGYFSATSQKVMAAVAVWTVAAGLAWLALGPVWGLALATGFVVGYGSYELVHRRLHTHPPTNFYGRWARKHHFYHHFMRATSNHGVTSPVWDMVFGTHAKVEQVRVPRKRAMAWLLDPATGEVAEAYARDYVLAGRAPKA